ncbi:MAG: glycosyl transferase [Bacteroidia bacterium]|nr:MAG: glycosyl transferase [Bacteroidia bacterium]
MKKNKLVVFGIHRPNRAPNERYRWFQYERQVHKHFDVMYYYLINERFDKILFHSKNILLKFFVLILTFIKRTKQIVFLNKTDVILIYRELHWFHCPFWMWILKFKAKKIIFDFDDAIFLPSGKGIVNTLKQPYSKTIHFIKNSDGVIVGNEYLRQFALKYNSKVVLVPTTVDTNYFIPKEIKNKENKITIGWMGSHSTIPHLLSIVSVLKKIQQKYSHVELKFIATKTFISELNLFIEDWEKEQEVDILNSFDIGIMPLPDDDWSKGKCGLKMLTYLSCAVPCVASNVGVNAEIIEKTKGGFVVNSESDWIEKLSILIENEELRKQLGKQGREGVEKYYSVKVWQDIFVQILLN